MKVYRRSGLYEVQRDDGSRLAVFFSLDEALAFIKAHRDL